MQIHPRSNQQQISTHSFNPSPTYSRFLFFIGMVVTAILGLSILAVMNNKYNPLAVSHQQNEAPTETEPQPIIVEVPSQPIPDNDIGLTLEEYNNLSDPSEETLNCLLYEGGKGCLDYDYQPNIPQYKSPMFPKLPNVRSVAIAVASGRELLYWQPNYNLRPMPQGVCPPSLVIAYQNQLFCGRRPIAKQPQTVRRLWQ